MERKYGWQRDLPDHRDFLMSAAPSILKKLGPAVDLRSKCPPIYNQYNMGSCTANAIGSGFQFDQIKQKLPVFMPSRLFIYYNERATEGTTASDAGADIRDGIKVINSQGVCDERLWQYNTGNLYKKPSQACYDAAKNHVSLTYARVAQNLQQIKGILAGGNPIVFGISVYESFESQAVAKTGKVPMPSNREQLLGGHAILQVGYDDSLQSILCRNSWGTDWGLAGYFWLPYAYVLNENLASDLWVLSTVR